MSAVSKTYIEETGTMGRAVVVRIPEPLLKEIDKVRAARLDRPSRSTMIRELLVDAIRRANRA